MAYFLQRIFYTVPIVILVALVTFILFFMFVPPEVMAKRHLRAKNPTREDLRNWLEKHGYDKPLFLNTEPGPDGQVRPWDSQFLRHLRSMFLFDFGRSDQTNEKISAILLRKMWPSLMLTVPAFCLSLFIYVSCSLFVAYCRGTYVDHWGLVICVLLMAIPALIYVIAGQAFFSLYLRLSPVSGWDEGIHAVKFLTVPVFLAVLMALGRNIRFYRTVMLEELNQDYVRTARAKGMPESRVLFRDVLKNSMIPILTNTIMSIPFLFLGSLLLENSFGIPGLGSFTIDAIHASDFSAIRALVFLGSLLYIFGLLLTDLSYTLVNPRIRFQGTPLGRMAVPVLASAGLVALGGASARGITWFSLRMETAKMHLPAPWIIENSLVVVLLAGAGWTGWKAWQREYWREAFRRFARNRLALAALGIVCLYLFLAAIDSISWKEHRTDLRPKTLLDRVAQRERERTYSAPLAHTEYAERNARPLKHGLHLLGTDSTGDDVVYLSLKGVRTGVIIGLFTTLIVLPIAVAMGVGAGYFGGWIDDTVQLLYTMLMSIPEILLLVSLMIVLGRGLPQLCVALGVTSWVGLCRLLRAETLKIRELEYVQAAQSLGMGQFKILWRHILPNVMHLILITFVLRFSGLVMSEVILSYLGIGVAPGTGSWGSMIDGARLELAREPVVWWNICAAFGAMFFLVLCFNYFGDVLRDALDPRLRER